MNIFNSITRTKTRAGRSLVLSFVAIAVFGWSLAAPGLAQTQQLPIDVYLGQLGPLDALGWSDPKSGNFMVIDVYGKLNATRGLGLDTTVTGGVSVTPLPNNLQRVTVRLLTNNALCYGFNGDGAAAFGYRPLEVLNGVGPAALGRAMTSLVYSPQPIGPIDFGGPLDRQMTSITCDGQLRAGSGYPAGTPGFAQTTQTGLFSTGAPGGCPLEGDADCFPAEKVQFKARGN